MHVIPIGNSKRELRFLAPIIIMRNVNISRCCQNIGKYNLYFDKFSVEFSSFQQYRYFKKTSVIF